MYPLKFENLYYEKIWGGRDLESFRDNLPSGDIGESWDVACHENGMSIVKNGEDKGKTFKEIIEKYGKDLLGEKYSGEVFPLLIKLINSRDKLSVQVHPGDEYAQKHENQFGKTEAWYVVDAKENSYLIVGTKNCDRNVFEKAVNEGKTEEYLNKIPVKKGDCFLINSGLVHAICEGVIIAEIQQNSDVTYRIYDYGRPREIHVEKSLDVIKFELEAINLSNGIMEKSDGYSKGKLCACTYFTIEKYVITDSIVNKSNEEKFSVLTCVEGNGEICCENGFKEKISMGDSLLIPAKLGVYTIKGNITILKTYI